MSPHETTDILIPVHNQPQAVFRLIRSIARNTSKDHPYGRIIIGDDASDKMTSEYLDNLGMLFPSLDITVLHHKKNLGYAGNCNSLFAESNVPLVILLNSDLVLPPFWFERMIAPFEKREDVILATPLATNAVNHTVHKVEGQTWVDLDRVMKSIKPEYPDACTAIGFCLGVRRSFFSDNNEPLFDEIFGRGYGEDSDLHFRVTTNGGKSIIVDNLLTHHVGGCSFASMDGLDEMKKRNLELFLKRWGDVYKLDLEKYNKTKTMSRRRHPKSLNPMFRARKEELDVLFVLPAMHRRYGGIRVIAELVDDLLEMGIRAAVYTQTPHWTPEDIALYGFHPWFQKKQLYKHIKNVKLVFASNDGSVKDAREIAEHYNSELDYFVQGPEILFNAGVNACKTLSDYSHFKRMTCVSVYLEEFLGNFCDAKVRNITLGADALTYYPSGAERESNTIAISLNADQNKGSGFSMHFALLAKKMGFKIYFFGFDSDSYEIPEDIGEVLGCLDEKGLSNLFNKVEFFVDFSMFEGLGLLPLEAAYCGAIPVLSKKGAPDFIFEDGKNALFMENFMESKATVKRLSGMSSNEKKLLSDGAVALQKKYHQKDAFSRFADYLSEEYSIISTTSSKAIKLVKIPRREIYHREFSLRLIPSFKPFLTVNKHRVKQKLQHRLSHCIHMTKGHIRNNVFGVCRFIKRKVFGS